MDKDYSNGSTVRVNPDGSITVHKLAGGAINQSAKIVLPAGEYILWNGLDSGNKIYLQIGWDTIATTLSAASEKYKYSGGEIDLYLYSDPQTTGDVTLFPTLIPSGRELLYEPYRGETFEIPLGETMYGGYYDSKTGILTKTHACIDSYNGEDVGDDWISSTGSLSTGSQVVYRLSEPVTVQLSTTEIRSISGINTVFADCGSIRVQGPSSDEKYTKIEDKRSSLTNTWSSETFVKRFCPPFEVSGSVITCNPVEASKLNAIIQIEATQDGEGDPSPENVRPIKGFDTVNVWREGKNLIDQSLYENAGKWIYESETWTAINPVCNYLILKSIKLKTGTYTISFNASVGTDKNARFVVSKDSTNAAGDAIYSHIMKEGENKITFELSEDTSIWLKIASYTDMPENAVNIFNIRVEVGAVATPYEPYCGETFTIPLGQTVYGGTLDLTSGALTVTHTLVVLNGLELPLSEGPLFNGYAIDYNGPYANGKLPICNIAKGVILHQTTGYTLRANYNQFRFQGFAEYCPTVNDFKAFLQTQNAQIVVELASPIVIQLTPQEIYALSGVNTLYADTGDITVSGYSNPNAIINSLAERIAALESAATNM